MNSAQQNLLHAVNERMWVWDSDKRILHLSTSLSFETNPQFVCNLIHKLMYFNPKVILIRSEGHWYEIRREYLDLIKKCAKDAKREKIRLYRAFSERSYSELDLKDIREKISIHPFYGSIYSRPILQLPPLNGFLMESQLRRCKKAPKIRKLERHYVLGHLLYCIDIGSNSYRVSFQSDNLFWIEKELSTILRLIYSEKMLNTGKFKDIFEFRLKAGLKFLNLLTTEEMDEPAKSSLVKHAVYSSMGLSKIYPLVNDNNVQSFFLGDIWKKLYVDHAVFGRLNTNLIFSEKDFESLVTLVKRETGLNLDYSHPSIKALIFFNDIPTRISIDIPPITFGSGVIDVRKHMVKTLALKELLQSGYFSIESAAFLIFALLNRANISIIGEPNSGKTSLLNFLSYFFPSWWRIIHIEDALETFPPKTFDQHRVVYIVEPFESRGKNSTKTLEIVKVLHRTPSYLILGELQTKSHMRAMFQAISAGLRVMHTAHALSSEGFIKRLMEVYNIPRPLISELDLIILMKRLESNNGIKRVIGEIVEISEDLNPSKLFSRSSFFEGIHYRPNLDTSRIFEKLARLNYIDEKNLYGEYREVENILMENHNTDNLTIKSLIHKTHMKMLEKLERNY